MLLRMGSGGGVRRVALDAIVAALSLVLAVALRLRLSDVPAYIDQHRLEMVLVPVIFAVTFWAINGRSLQGRCDPALTIVSHVAANGLALLVALAFVYLQGLDRIGRGVFLLFGGLHLFTSVGCRLLTDRIENRFRTPRRALIVGSGEPAEELVTLLKETKEARVEPVGLLLVGEEKPPTTLEGLPTFSGSAVLHELARLVRADCVVLTPPYRRDDELLAQLLRCRLEGLAVSDAVQLHEQITERVSLSYVDDHWGLFLSLSRIRPIEPTLKRLVDLVGSLALLVVLGPVIAFVAAMIRVLMPRGPVFYRQDRLGQHGRVVKLIKFRTMIPDAEAGTGAVWATEEDPRITPLGRFLRRTRLDELPQLLNVVRGELSLVGPRPEREVFVSEFLQKVPAFRRGRRQADPETAYFVAGVREAITLYSTRLLVKPGLTGWAQVCYHYAASLEESRRKFEYDLYYIKNQSLLFDLSILLRTAASAFRLSGR